MISSILPALADRDTKERLAAVSRLHDHLTAHGLDDGSNESNTIDALTTLVQDNNFKVSHTALACLELVIEQLDGRFRSYMNLVLGVLVERLGDNKTVVRAKALDVLNTMVRVLSPATCLDKLIPLLGHKNARVREQTLWCLCNTLDTFGPEALSLPKMLPHLVKRLDDSQKDVRLAAIGALEEWYRYVGGPLRNELQRREIRPAILKMLFERFDEVEASGSVETNLSRVSSVDSLGGSTPGSTNSGPEPKLSNNTGSTPRSSGRKGRSVGGSPRSESSGNGISLWWDLGVEGCCQATCSGVVEPKQVYTDKELTKELAAVFEPLQTGTEGDWNMRMKGMKHLQSLVLGGCGEFGVWVGHMRELKDALAVQLTDLRSAIIRDACATIALMSACCPDTIEPHVEVLLEGMLKLTNQSIAVIAMAGVQGTRSVVNTCVSPKCVSKMLEICAVKAPAHRRRAVEVLAQILESYPTSILEKFVDPLMASVRSYVSDRDVHVRAAGRVCFFAFCALWQQRGKELFQTVDASMQRVLSEGESSYEPGALGREIATGTRSSNIGSGPSTPSSRAQSAAKPRTQRTQPQPKPKPGRPPMMERQRSAELPGGDRHKPNNGSASTRSTSVGRSHHRASRPTDPMEESEQPSRAPNPNPTPNPNPSRAHPNPNPNPSRTHRQAKSSNTQPPRSQHSNPNPQHSNPNPQHSNLNGPPPRSQHSSQQQPASTERHSSQQLPASTDRAPRQQESLQSLMAHANDDDWSVRVQALTQLQHRISPKPDSQLAPELHNLLRLLIHRLTDQHYRVCLAVLGGLDKMVEFFPDLIQAQMDRLLPKLVHKVLDPKDMVRQKADEITELLIGTCSGESSVPVLIRLLDGPSNSRIKLCVVQWLTQLVLDDELPPAFTKPAFTKVVGYVGDKSIDLRHAVADMFQAMYEAEPLTLFRLIHQLPPTQEQEIKALMAPVLPQFEGQLAMHRAREQNQSLDQPAPSQQWPPHKLGKGPSSGSGRPVQDAPREQATPSGYHPSMYQPTGHETPPPVASTLEKEPQDEEVPRASGQSVSASMVPSLLSDMSSSSPQRRKDSLHKIIRLCRSGTSWVSYFGQILLVVLEALCDDEPVIRELSLVVIKEMLRSQPTSFVDFIEVVMVKLLEKYRDTTREVCQAAEDALDQLISAVNPNRCVDTLIPLISSEGGAVLQASIRMLSKLVPMLPPVVLLEHVPQMCPGLFDAFKNPCADVRKAVVFCLVDIYMVLGDEFAPYLGELNTSQLKLVTIYINRTMQQRGIQRPGQSIK